MAKILLIDDDPLILTYLDRILQGSDHTIVGITRSIDAVAQFEQLKPDLVVLDIWMPGQDGFETLRAIRKIDSKVKVIACSGHPSYWGRRVADVANERGATAFMEKPFTVNGFISLVAEVLKAESAQPGIQHPAPAEEAVTAG